MSSWPVIIVVLISVGVICSISNTLKTDYFNRKIWFNDGNIFHINQQYFWTVFQQHRNVNRHMDWLTNEISSINHQIKLVKTQLTLISDTQRQHSTAFHHKTIPTPNSTSLYFQNNTQRTSSSSTSRSPIRMLRNQRNIHIVKLLSTEKLFDGYRQDLIDIYALFLTTTIECIAIVIEKESLEKYLFIKLSNGTIDTYQMNKSKSLKETYWKINQPLSIWNNAGKQLEYYRRFLQDNKTNEIMINNQLAEIRNRPKLHDLHFFDMMGQILRIKYHIDSSSYSCILEAFFDSIYTCDGRLVYPHELRLLSNDNDIFVFYAVMMDTTIDKQIYPLDSNNRIRHGDQIFFLFNNHPQFSSLSSLTCPDCIRDEHTFLFNNNPEQVEHHIDEGMLDPPPIIGTEQNFLIINIQNFIVYAIVTSLLLYILFGIFISRQRGSMRYSSRKQSILSRRGR